MKDLNKFYSILSQLEQNIGGERRLVDCNGRMSWPERGVYFFKEAGEFQTGEKGKVKKELRIVRIGTHALRLDSKKTLWKRLREHRGTAKSKAGHHRTSIFRLLVGVALAKKNGYTVPGWGIKPKPENTKNERSLEEEVSWVIGNMPFLWLPIEDEPGPESLRGYIERNSIAFLSSYNSKLPMTNSSDWLGQYCGKEKVIYSGLWNQQHVGEDYDPAFLDRLEQLVWRMGKCSR